MRYFRHLICSLAVLAFGGIALAGDLVAFNAAIDTASKSNQAALEYVRRGDVELATVELAQARQRWAEIVQRFGSDRPAEIKDAQLYTTTFTTVNAQLVGADIMLKSGRLEAAAKALEDVEHSLDGLRPR